MKTYYVLLFGLIIIGCQNRNREIKQVDPINLITYKYNGVMITRIDKPGISKFIYGEKDDQNIGVIWAEYSGINDGFKGYLEFLDNGKVFLLSGDGYFQSKDIDTSKFEYKRIYAYDEVYVGENICHIMLSTRYEQEFNDADRTGIIIDYQTK